MVARLRERLFDAAEHAVAHLRSSLAAELAAQRVVGEGVAHAPVAGDLDALPHLAGHDRPEHGQRAERRHRRVHGFLARVARGAGVRDVVRGRVERTLLRMQAAQGDVQTVEGGDRHQALASSIETVRASYAPAPP